MADIKLIEIICKPCHKCDILEQRVIKLMECMATKYNVKMKYIIKRNKNIKMAEKYGYNLTQIPVLLINGNLAFVGHVKGEDIIRMKLEEILKG